MLNRIICIVALLCIASPTSADITFGESGVDGTYTVTYLQKLTGMWHIELTATAEASGGYFVNITANLPNDSIRYVRVTANRTHSSGWVGVNIRPASDFPSSTIPILRDCFRT